MDSSKIIGINIDGVDTYHITAAIGAFDTICGLDAHDSSVGHFGIIPTANVPKKQKITCSNCKQLFEHIKKLKFKVSDFE